MTKDEVLVCKHALMTLESALTMLSNSNIPNSELMPILNMYADFEHGQFRAGRFGQVVC